MEGNLDKDCGALGGLFQQIVQEMKASSPIWEDFLQKSAILHKTLRATVLATSAFLETFQRVADMATNTKGATREVGAALTRLCMRHRSIENKLKGFTTAIMDAMVIPMSEKMEEWKKNVIQLDKDHAKEYKRARAEIKKAASDTFRLQKKVKKGKSDMQNRLDNALQEVNDKYLLLEETEKNAVRTALIEQRSHFCQFICCLKPVVDQEIQMLTEVTHLTEIVQSLCLQAGDPRTLPAASEQVIMDLKGKEGTFQYQHQSPPSSPSSLGSRKSSMCSISSINSSSSGSSKGHSPSHVHRRSASQQPTPGTVRLSSVSSQDSGFTSQDTLFLRPPTPPAMDFRKKGDPALAVSVGDTGPPGTQLYTGPPSATASTWTNWPEPPHGQKVEPGQVERPHTISSAYEKNHNRPALSANTFEPPENQKPHSQTAPTTPSPYAVPVIPGKEQPAKSKPKENKYAELRLGPKPKGRPVAPPIIPDYNMLHADQIIPQPVYMNMNELANMAMAEQRKRSSKHEAIEEGSEPELEDVDLGVKLEVKPEEKRKTEVSALSRAIQELDISTAHLNESSTDDFYHPQWALDAKVPNSLELAEAIRELEASTAELQMSYDPTNNRHSLQCSSGYGTMNSTPSLSEDTIPSTEDLSCDLDNLPPPMPDKFSTIPRSGDTSGYSTAPDTNQRPLSTSGMSPIQQGIANLRRTAMPQQQQQEPLVTGRPPPPIRRSSSATYATPVVPSSALARKQSQGSTGGSNTPTPQGSPEQQRRTFPGSTAHDDLGLPPPEAAPPPIVGHFDEGIQIRQTQGHSGVKTRNSISATHSNIMQSLNAKFAAKRSSLGAVPLQQSPSLDSQSSEDVTPTEQAPAETFLTQIRRGVSLRRVQSNDRSNPRIS